MTEPDRGRPAPTTSGASPDPARPDPARPDPARPDPARDPASPPVDLLGAVAYGALTAFTRLAADAALAPDLTGRAEMAALAAVEMAHVERVRAHLGARGVDLVTAMAPFAPVLDAFAARTASREWGEALVGAYAGRTLAVDLVAATGAADGGASDGAADGGAADGVSGGAPDAAPDAAPDDPRGAELLRGPDTGREATGASGFDAFAERAVGELVTDEQIRGRLAMWGRRLLGETLAAATEVLEEHPRAASALLGGTSRDVVFKALKSRHTKRMRALGL